MEQIIQTFAREHGIVAGICDANPLEACRPFLERETPFVTKDVERRITPAIHLPTVQSILVMGVPYRKQVPVPKDQTPRGKISISAVGEDYHRRVRRLLTALVQRLQQEATFEYEIFVDTGDLVERALAVEAGIGFQGKNCAVISPEWGSYISLGHALLSLPLIPSKGTTLFQSVCGTCTKCQNACPTNALAVDYQCEASRCVSYLTQKKEAIPFDLQKKMGNALYGCDRCQEVCPYNEGRYCGTLTDGEAMYPKLTDVCALTNKTFKAQYGDSALFWRGKNVFVRNAAIAMENHTQDYEGPGDTQKSPTPDV